MNKQATELKSSQINSNVFVLANIAQNTSIALTLSLSHLQGAIKNSYRVGGLYKNGCLRRAMVSPSQSINPCRFKEHLVTISVDQWLSGVLFQMVLCSNISVSTARIEIQNNTDLLQQRRIGLFGWKKHLKYCICIQTKVLQTSLKTWDQAMLNGSMKLY